jgi:predicted esterase YcpF (UPF0227 family)
MQSVIGVYLHGFLSCANSQKGRWLVQQVHTENTQSRHVAESVSEPVFKEAITLTYPICSPAASIRKIEALIQDLLAKNNHSIVLMGSSMGGYYAQFLGQKYQLPYLMINPALNPQPLFQQHLGASVNPSTGEKFVIDDQYIQGLERFDCAVIDKSIPTLLLLDDGDEVIDLPFALEKYPTVSEGKSVVSVFKGGDHAFQHLEEAWPIIKDFVKSI